MFSYATNLFFASGERGIMCRLNSFFSLRCFFLIIALGMLLSCSITKTVVGIYSEEGISYQENRPIGPFSNLSVSGCFNVYYHQSDNSYILVEGDEHSVKSLITDVSDDTLSIILGHGQYKNITLRVSVFAPSLRSIQLSGSGRLICDKIQEPIKGLVRCHLSGSGRIEVRSISCITFIGDVDGSGELIIGRIDSESSRLSLSGSTSSSIKEMNADYYSHVSLRGSGNLIVDKLTTLGILQMSLIGKGMIKVVDGQCNHLLVSSDRGGVVSGKVFYNTKEISCYRGGHCDF